MKRCPNCRLINPDSTLSCDCGYGFVSGVSGQKVSRQFLGVQVTDIILGVGLIWGIFLFFSGLKASFTIGGPDFIAGLVGVGAGYILVLPITIAAYMWPKAAAVCLLISFLVLEVAAIASSAGFRVAFLGGLITAVPTAALIWGYMYVASIPKKSS